MRIDAPTAILVLLMILTGILARTGHPTVGIIIVTLLFGALVWQQVRRMKTRS